MNIFYSEEIFTMESLILGEIRLQLHVLEGRRRKFATLSRADEKTASSAIFLEPFFRTCVRALRDIISSPGFSYPIFFVIDFSHFSSHLFAAIFPHHCGLVCSAFEFSCTCIRAMKNNFDETVEMRFGKVEPNYVRVVIEEKKMEKRMLDEYILS